MNAPKPYSRRMEKEPVSGNKWDAASLAALGASVGLVAAGAHIIAEVYLHDPGELTSPVEVRSFARMLAEIIAAMVAGAVVFAATAMIRNVVVARNDGREKPSARKRWDPAGLALIGGGLGILLVVAHEAYVIFSGRFHNVDPFVHIITEMAILGSGLALVFAAVAVIRNRLTLG